MNTFYKNANEIELEKERLEVMTKTLDHKKTEKSLKDLIYINLISRKQRYASLAVIMFNFYPPFAGQAYSDAYTTQIFDQLVYKGFGYEVTFYSGFASLAGGIVMMLCVNRVGRATVIVWTSFGFFICMYLLAVAFYMNWVWFAFSVQLIYSFILNMGTIGITFVFMNEIAEPFSVGVAMATNWICKSLIGLVLPYIYDG